MTYYNVTIESFLEDMQEWRFQCPKLSAEEQAELSKDKGLSLLNVASFGDDVYATEDKYKGVAFVSPVMVQGHTLDLYYLCLDSCLVFNQVFTKNHISDLELVRISSRAGCNTGTSTSDEKEMILGAIKAWLVRTGIVNLASIPQMEQDVGPLSTRLKAVELVHRPTACQSCCVMTWAYATFPLVDLRDPEIRRAFAQIEAKHQVAVVEHVMANVAEDGDMSDG